MNSAFEQKHHELQINVNTAKSQSDNVVHSLNVELQVIYIHMYVCVCMCINIYI